MIYLFGGDEKESRKILARLRVPKPCEEPQLLRDFSPETTKLPILISSGGEFHGDTITFSRKLISSPNAPNTKIIFDRHADFLRGVQDYASHAFQTYEEGFLDELGIFGIEEFLEKQIEYNRPNAKPTRTSLTYSTEIDGINEIKDKRLHISVDVDVIGNTRCVRPNWGGETGPTLPQLTNAIRTLKKNNEIVALDVVGYVPDDLEASPLRETEGLKIYREVIASVF